MIEKILDKLIQLLKREDVISEYDTDLYAYGLFQFIMMCLNVGTTILVGVLLKAFIPCILLNVSYIPLRISAGGFHAKTPFKCYLYSTAIIASLLLVLKYVPISLLTSLTLLIISTVVIWFKDSSDFNIYLTIAHKNDNKNVDTDSVTSNKQSSLVSKNDIDFDDMRHLKKESNGFYTDNDGFTYQYVLGKLLNISWSDNDMEYTLSGSSYLNDYPMDKDTFTASLLKI